MNALISGLNIDGNSNPPRYLQISNGMVKLIRKGELQVGSKLPGTRHLAANIGVHRKTLQMALDELHAQGWLEIIPRKGTFVARNLPEFEPNKNISMAVPLKYPEQTNFKVDESAMKGFPRSDLQKSGVLILAEGLPDIRLAPMKLLLREIRSIERSGAFRKYYQYGDPQGTTYLREILCTFLRGTRAMQVSSENILITRGAQMGLYLAARVLIKPGDHIVVGDPGYVTSTMTLASMGAVVHRIPVDDKGISTEMLEKLCRKKPVRLVYIIPHHHHPTTVTLTPERRIRLLHLAGKYKFAIVEDDYDYDFHYQSNPLIPMASLDHSGNVVYIGTLAKTLVPSIRVGFLIAPVNFIREAVATRRSIDFQGDSILEIAIAELYRNGVITNHIKKAVKTYLERRDHFCALLRDELGAHVSFKIPDGGLSVWTKFHGTDMKKLANDVAKKGVIMIDGTYYNTAHSNNCTRLGFSALNLEEQEKTVGILKEAIRRQ